MTCVCVCACARAREIERVRTKSHSYWRWILAVSLWCRNKIFTEAQKVSLAKIEDQNYVDHFFFISTKNLCLIEQKWTVNSSSRCWEGYCSRFVDWGRNFKKNAFGSFCTSSSAHSATDWLKDLLSNCGVGISHPPYSSDFAPADFSIFLKVKTAVKGRWFQDTEDIKKKVTAELNAVPTEVFNNWFWCNLQNNKKKSVTRSRWLEPFRKQIHWTMNFVIRRQNSPYVQQHSGLGK